jgi:DNA-binding IclR family transcriptional regulator
VLQALAAEPLVSATSEDFRSRHGLPGASSVQRALDALTDEELVLREGAGAYRIGEPFLAEWFVRLGRSP